MVYRHFRFDYDEVVSKVDFNDLTPDGKPISLLAGDKITITFPDGKAVFIEFYGEGTADVRPLNAEAKEANG